MATVIIRVFFFNFGYIVHWLLVTNRNGVKVITNFWSYICTQEERSNNYPIEKKNNEKYE